MDMDWIKAAHAAEVSEAEKDKLPLTLTLVYIPEERAKEAIKTYLRLISSKAFFDAIIRLTEGEDVEREALENIKRAAMKADDRLEGAKSVFKALGIDIDKIEQKAREEI